MMSTSTSTSTSRSLRCLTSGSAIVFATLAVWIGSLSSWHYGVTVIDPQPSFETERVDLPSPTNEKDPLLIDSEHVLLGLEAPEDGIRLDDGNGRGDDDWIWSMGNGDLLRVNLRTMVAFPFAHTGENHKECGAMHLEDRCGRPLGLLKLPREDHERYQRYYISKPNNNADMSMVSETESEMETPLFLVADAYKGLMLVFSEGTIVPLLTAVAGKSLFFANALARARDGTIYLSDSSSRFRRNQVLLETLESRPSGRVISWNPDTGTSSVVADNLPFPNGLVLRDNDRSLLVSLTTRQQIVRIDLAIQYSKDSRSVGNNEDEAYGNGNGNGKTPARQEVFAALPGIPDNLHVSYSDEWKRSVLWVGMSTKSSAVVRFLNRQPRLRKLLAMLPGWLLIKCFKRYGLLLALDADTGRMLHAYQDPTGTTAYISGIHFDESYAYLGSWKNHFLARIPRNKLFSVDPSL
eukprot:CAMPEP_0168169432 /NCGR_PEP_ID=MMETSP0139_2-20121125/3633_1 /TAXON_ID=44445 /ORGANISM="Pseudo-nitzschia australis, Strain 10249 10 AB" /LENGTH=464 /DNA_ID=CAMNT_0008086847 /DNA_START=1347 /DNA_END=2741 /DNA_ORIENTATION=+